MAAKNEEITLSFEHEKNVFGEGLSRAIVGICRYETDRRKKVTVVGPALEDELDEGGTYRFFGHWKKHPTYGRQFRFRAFVAARPIAKEGIINYLQKAPGIGQKAAEAAYKAWGGNAIKVIREEPRIASQVLRGFTADRAHAASEWLKHRELTEDATADLMGS